MEHVHHEQVALVQQRVHQAGVGLAHLLHSLRDSVRVLQQQPSLHWQAVDMPCINDQELRLWADDLREPSWGLCRHLRPAQLLCLHLQAMLCPRRPARLHVLWLAMPSSAEPCQNRSSCQECRHLAQNCSSQVASLCEL